MLQYQSQEPSPIHSVRFSPDGTCLAVATLADRILWFEAAERITPRGSWDSGIQIVDMAFSSAGEQLAAIGCAYKAKGDYAEGELRTKSALTVLIADLSTA